jgi:signal transduction histidine kinase
MDCTHEWTGAGIEPQKENLQGVAVADFAWSNNRLMRGESLHIPRVADLPPSADIERAEFTRQDIQSLVAVPMNYRNEPIGFLGFDSVRAEKRWSSQTIALLRIVGEIFVNALEHKRAQAIQAGQSQFLELLASGGEFSATLRALVQIIEEQWPGMMGLVLLLDEEGEHLHLGASTSLPDDYVQSIEGLEIGPMVGSCGTASYTGERVVVEDIAQDPRWEGLRSLALEHGLRACWSEPVFSSRGEVIGTFAMYYRQPRSPGEGELQTIQTAAHLAGIAIEHKRAQEELQRAYQTLEDRVSERTRELSTLLEVSHNVASTLELEEVVNRILEQLGSVVEFDGASIMTQEDGRLSILAYQGPIPQEQALEIDFPLKDAGVNREVIVRREPIIVSDVRGDTPLARAFQESAGDGLDTTFGYVTSWMGIPLIIKDRVIGMLSLDHREPNKYTARQAELALAFANQVAVAIENARLFSESESQMEVLEALYLADEELYRHLALDDVLEALTGVAVKLLNAEKSSIMVWDAEEGRLVVKSAHGFRPDTLEKMTFQPGEGIVGQVFEQGLPSFVEDTHTHPTVARHITDPEDIRSFIHVPIKTGGKVFGVYNVNYTVPRGFDEEDQRLFTALGQRAALAIENATLYEQAQQLGTIEERQRLARELHDAVTQTLFSASLIAEVLPKLWERDPDQGRGRLEELRQLTRGALAEMRTLLLELRPTALVESRLPDLLHQLAEATTGRVRLPVEVEIACQPEFPPDVKVALYRIVQEALNNVAKHAAATRACVRLSCPSGEVRLSIEDDGRGFNPQNRSSDKLGLGIMQERAEAIHGSLTVESQPGKGTRVEVVWPLKNEE